MKTLKCFTFMLAGVTAYADLPDTVSLMKPDTIHHED